MVLRPLPAAQLGKKNAEPGKSLSVSSGVEGAGIDRAGAALAWVARGLYLQPLGFGLSLALNNCSRVLIGATMLCNAYIISQGEHCVSTLGSRRHRVRVGAGREEAGSGRREQTIQNSKEDRSRAHPALLLAGNEMECRCVTQAGLRLLASRDLPTSDSQSAGITASVGNRGTDNLCVGEGAARHGAPCPHSPMYRFPVSCFPMDDARTDICHRAVLLSPRTSQESLGECSLPREWVTTSWRLRLSRGWCQCAEDSHHAAG
nr:uncharacterized protein LOC109730105 isoform X2 [Microcebus murinus]